MELAEALVLAPHDVNVGAADRCRGDANDGLAGARCGSGHLPDRNVVLSLEYDAFMVFMKHSLLALMCQLTVTGIPLVRAIEPQG